MNTKGWLRKLAVRTSKYSVFLFGSVPVNRRYRPVGVKKLLPCNDGTIDYLELNPPYVSTLELDEKFVADCSPFAKPEMSVQMPGDYIVTVRNGRICCYDESNIAVITKNNYLIDDLSFQWDSEGEKMDEAKNNKVFLLKGFTKPKKYKGTVFSLMGGGGAKYYYYHWLIDAVARLGLLRKSGRFDEVDYFLVPNYNTRYQKETLTYLGIRAEKIIDEELVHHIEADRLIVTSYTEIKFHHPKWALDFLHDSFTISAPNKKRDKLIYIPRGDAARNRKVINEAELMTVLKDYGFDIRFLSEMTVPEEAEFFNSATLVLGAQGSGFANLVFCEPGTKVIEFFPSNYVRHIDYDICNKMGLEYHYLLCPAVGNATDTLDGQKVDLIADIPAITAKLDELLGREKMMQAISA